MSSRNNTVLIAISANHSESLAILQHFCDHHYRSGDQVHVLSIQNIADSRLPIMVTSEEPMIHAEYWTRAVEDARRELKNNLDVARHYLISRQVPAEHLHMQIERVIDSTADNLCVVAAKVSPDYIVMGHHHRSLFGRLFMGGTSSHVVHHSTIPVILVFIPAE